MKNQDCSKKKQSNVTLIRKELIMKRMNKIIRSVIVTMLVLCMSTMPVFAAENTNSTGISTEASVKSIPSGAVYRGTIYRNGGSVSLGRVTLVGSSRLYITFPKNSNLDLFQGSVTFRNGTQVITKNLTNMSLETWSYGVSDIGSGIWTVTVSGYAIGTTQKCEVWSKVE